MSVASVETALDRPGPYARATVPGPGRVRTRPGRTGPGVGPAARPRRLRFTAPPPARGPKACQAEPVVASARGWHLTERGLAVVLVLLAALLTASVVVVGLTALRVTGEGYHPGRTGVAPVVVQP